MSGQIIGPIGVLPAAGGGAQAFDQVSTATVAGVGGTTLTWTHTPVGVPTAVAVLIMNYEVVGSVTGVTYGGASMGAVAVSQTGIASKSYIFGLANPASGAQSVVITNSASNGFTQAFAITVTGSNTSTVFDTINANNAENNGGSSGTTPTLATVPSANAEIVIDIVSSEGDPTTETPAGGQTAANGVISAGGNKAFASYRTASGVSVSMSWTLGVTQVYSHCAVAFKT